MLAVKNEIYQAKSIIFAKPVTFLLSNMIVAYGNYAANVYNIHNYS